MINDVFVIEKEYPRPQFVRKEWTDLNWVWDFRIDDANQGEAESWYLERLNADKTIQVPFTYETAASGIGDAGFHPIVWYERAFSYVATGKRVLLHFEGVDYQAKVWVNGRFAGDHEGGYARFSFDITRLLEEGANRITVRAWDSVSCVQPRGKQRWKKENFGCWYEQTTGIWKSVWLEEVPQSYMESVKLTPDIDKAMVRFELKLNLIPKQDCSLACFVLLRGETVAEMNLHCSGVYVTGEMSVAGGDEPWLMELWTPENPVLYDVRFVLSDGIDTDRVQSYFGMRKISIENGKVLLNNRPYYQRLILDQGYWEESGLTPLSGEALLEDVELIKLAGYNGLRKHEKIEDERFLYWCDVKGLIVWCEMPSQYILNDDARECYTKQWMEIVRQNYNHPCIVTWTAFNESWGIDRIYSDTEQQRFTEAIYHLTKAYDGMRPVIVNDGWEHTVSDILTLHDYEDRGEVFSKRYADKELIVGNIIPFNKDRYAFAKGYSYREQPVILSEYGGIAFSSEDGWGYGEMVSSEEKFLERFEKITKAIKETEYMVGFCYTQLTDVQQEINGLYTIQRKPKVNIEEIRRINVE